jgi:hypothetical protein
MLGAAAGGILGLAYLLFANKKKNGSKLLPALTEEETLKILKGLDSKMKFVEQNFKKHAANQMQHMAQQGQVAPMEDILMQFCPFYEQEYTKHSKAVLDEFDILEYELEDAISVYCNESSKHYDEVIAAAAKNLRKIYKTFGGDIAELSDDVNHASEARGQSHNHSSGGGGDGELFDVDADGTLPENHGTLDHFIMVLSEVADVIGQVVDRFSFEFIKTRGLPTTPELSQSFTQSLMAITENTTNEVLQAHKYTLQDFEQLIQANSESPDLQYAFQQLQMASLIALQKHGITMQAP